MPLPRLPRDISKSTPNEPFDSPEVYAIRGPYWDMPIGPGLEFDPYGSVQTEGSPPSNPGNMLYGPSGWVGIGTGLQIGVEGEFETSP